MDKKFYDIDVGQMIQGKLVNVVERDLVRKEVNKPDREAVEYGNFDKLNFHVEEYENQEEEQTSRFYTKSIPTPTVSTDILLLQSRLNLTNPGHMGLAVILPGVLDFDIERMLNKSKEKYQINEFVSSLVPLNRELPDIRTDYCKKMNYSENLPIASVIMVFHSKLFMKVWTKQQMNPSTTLRWSALNDFTISLRSS